MPWINKFVEAEAPVPVWFYPLVFIHDTPSATSMAPASVPLSSVAGAFNSMTATIQSTFSGGSSGSGGSGGGGGGGGGGSG